MAAETRNIIYVSETTVYISMTDIVEIPMTNSRFSTMRKLTKMSASDCYNNTTGSGKIGAKTAD